MGLYTARTSATSSAQRHQAWPAAGRLDAAAGERSRGAGGDAAPGRAGRRALRISPSYRGRDEGSNRETNAHSPPGAGQPPTAITPGISPSVRLALEAAGVVPDRRRVGRVPAQAAAVTEVLHPH